MDYKDQEFQDFLNEHKALSKSELEGLNFPRKNFKKPQSPGIYTGTLVAKEWGWNMSLISYFELGEGLIDLVKLTTYRNFKGAYIPSQGMVALEKEEVGTKYTLHLEKSTKKIYLNRLIKKDVNTLLSQEIINIFQNK